VAGGNSQNLGRSDEINIYDASNTLVDRLTYNDQSMPSTIRTQNTSGWTDRENLGSNTISTWKLSTANDAQNSYLSTTGNLGNPGGYFIPLPRVKVVESGGTTVVAEGGATDTYTIVLNNQPTAAVTIAISPIASLAPIPLR
jgi:predicted extracellular nuclease